MRKGKAEVLITLIAVVIIASVLGAVFRPTKPREEFANTPQQFDESLWPIVAAFEKKRRGVLPSGREEVAGLSAQKNAIKTAVFSEKYSWNIFKFMLAAGMMESQTLRNSARDPLKDGGPAANYSFLNLNQDMIYRAVPQAWTRTLNLGDPRNCILNKDTPAGLIWTVRVFAQCIKYYGFEPYVRFVRGGADAWMYPNNGWKYKMDQYLDGFAMTMRVIWQNQKNILTSNDRFWVQVDYV